MLKEFKGYKKGVNLGGWLSQCNHTVERYENFIVEEDIKKLASWGIDHLRVPVDYNLVEDKDGNYIESGFGYIQRAIDWCGKYGLNMILDLHKTFGYSFDSGEKELGFFENEKYQERFCLLWEQFAKRYGNIGDRVAFELLNEVTEPSYGPIWNDISTKCIKRIRQYAPNVKILLGGYWNNSATAVKDLAMPVDENIVYNFHCYDPLIFTHQGATWLDVMPGDYRMGIDLTYDEFAEIHKAKFPTFAGGFHCPGDSSMKFGKEFFMDHFAEAVKVAEERNVALYCGEYGVIDYANPKDVVLWYKYINETFEYYGLGRAAWSYKSMNFGLSDAWLEEVRDQVIALL